MMDAAALGAVLRGAEHDLFRLETLDFYEPDREGYERWLAGDGLDEAVMGPWLGRLRAEKARGLRRRRVHVLRSPIGPYLRFECGEIYARNAEAGEDIRILDLAEAQWRGLVLDQDFWIVDGSAVILMRYGPAGEYLGAETVTGLTAAVYLSAHDTAWSSAEPFKTWWARHRSDRKAA